MIRTKSVYSPINPRKDGLRILTTRIRGRGLPKSRYHVWMANLGPSERLLTLMRLDKISWADFGRRYRRELFGSSVGFDKSNKGIKNHGQKDTLRLIQQLGQRGKRHIDVSLRPRADSLSQAPTRQDAGGQDWLDDASSLRRSQYDFVRSFSQAGLGLSRFDV
jgi:uncharacterized protein YeaO (DUF488 family)